MPTTNKEREMRIAERRVEGFAQQFGEAHRNLARHAAFPLVLTPDLLYQIWANFVPEAPWTAVAHVLLSRLCRQVGYEMYEMDISDRNLLLRELKEQFGQERFNELGEFLLDYVAQRLTEDDADTQDLREAQEWTALAYTKPDEAARELAEILSLRVKQEDVAEVFRLTPLVETFAEPLVEAGYEPLLVYASGISHFVRGNRETALEKFSKLGVSSNGQIIIVGVNVEIPPQLCIDINEGNYNEFIEGNYVQERNNFLNGNYNDSIDINEGNYNDLIEGNYVQKRNNFLNDNFVFSLFRRQGSNEVLTSEKRSRIRQALLQQVNNEVEMRIKISLHNKVYIAPNIEQNLEQIELPWSSEIKVKNKPKVKLVITNIIKVFDQEDVAGRLLILGQPGSGKTTILLKLAEELVKRAKDNSRYPVPVLFSLSSWRNYNQSIKDWLVDQVAVKYGVRKDIGKQLVNNQEIIPLLDGLDELAADRQEKCVLKINEFLHPSNWNNPVIVCSRIQEYQHYRRLLQLNSSLELYPFSQEQIYQYLQRTDNLQLWDSISHDANLSQLATSPLLLSILVLSAQEISIVRWQQMKSTEERLEYLLDAYVSRMLRRQYRGNAPTVEQTRLWLSYLAKTLEEEGKTEFSSNQIQISKLQKYLRGEIPWNYRRFLDYATDRLLLERIGSRYRFIHKLLQVYFAKANVN